MFHVGKDGFIRGFRNIRLFYQVAVIDIILPEKNFNGLYTHNISALTDLNIWKMYIIL